VRDPARNILNMQFANTVFKEIAQFSRTDTVRNTQPSYLENVVMHDSPKKSRYKCKHSFYTTYTLAVIPCSSSMLMNCVSPKTRYVVLPSYEDDIIGFDTITCDGQTDGRTELL